MLPHGPLPAQVEKAVKTRRAKLVLLAPNIASLEGAADAAADAAAGSEAEAEVEGEGSAQEAQRSSGGGGGHPAAALVALARQREVPLVFALSRQAMGKVRWGGVTARRCRPLGGQLQRQSSRSDHALLTIPC